jgi:hypothetical protein
MGNRSKDRNKVKERSVSRCRFQGKKKTVLTDKDTTNCTRGRTRKVNGTSSCLTLVRGRGKKLGEEEEIRRETEGSLDTTFLKRPIRVERERAVLEELGVTSCVFDLRKNDLSS